MTPQNFDQSVLELRIVIPLGAMVNVEATVTHLGERSRDLDNAGFGLGFVRQKRRSKTTLSILKCQALHVCAREADDVVECCSGTEHAGNVREQVDSCRCICEWKAAARTEGHD